MVNKITVKTILNNSKKRDDWFLGRYTLNTYAGCSMACIYCYTRGSKYGGDHGSVVSAKLNAVPVLKKQLKNCIRRNERDIILFGSAADPYSTVEKDLNLTREVLGIIKRYKFPTHILTKSKQIIRDLDIIKDIRDVAMVPDDLVDKLKNGVIVSFSFSTLDEELAEIIEPGAPSPLERLETMKEFSDAGFKTGIINMPILPFLSDSDEAIKSMVKTAKFYGAHYVLYSGLTLYGSGNSDCKTLYLDFLREHNPDLVKEYEILFQKSFAPPKKYSFELSKRFSEISSKYGVKNSIL
ncbi:Radical SAM domain protein [Methanobacterium lacus]|uniref:Radical SAM domain protein n=1 Tax=Methanobacterium lacus (strain AL-21) TaxID=877455 RepID=F0T9L0_METLA|nr:radical SAM protein [Methanobacterium lacus]ADZ08758.1 Radical SAM domain protein [Methanobacterium lacus]